MFAIIIAVLIRIGLSGAEAAVASACAYQFSSSFGKLFKTMNDNVQAFELEGGEYENTLEVTIPSCIWGAAIYHKYDTLRIVYRSEILHAQNVVSGGFWGMITGIAVAIVGIALSLWTGGASLTLTFAGKAITAVAAGAALGSLAGAGIAYRLGDYCIDMPFVIAFGSYEDFRGVNEGAYKMECGGGTKNFDIIGGNTHKIRVTVNDKTMPIKVTNLGCFPSCAVTCEGCG
jgi:hypothetical protein